MPCSELAIARDSKRFAPPYPRRIGTRTRSRATVATPATADTDSSVPLNLPDMVSLAGVHQALERFDMPRIRHARAVLGMVLAVALTGCVTLPANHTPPPQDPS